MSHGTKLALKIQSMLKKTIDLNLTDQKGNLILTVLMLDQKMALATSDPITRSTMSLGYTRYDAMVSITDYEEIPSPRIKKASQIPSKYWAPKQIWRKMQVWPLLSSKSEASHFGWIVGNKAGLQNGAPSNIHKWTYVPWIKEAHISFWRKIEMFLLKHM